MVVSPDEVTSADGDVSAEPLPTLPEPGGDALAQCPVPTAAPPSWIALLDVGGFSALCDDLSLHVTVHGPDVVRLRHEGANPVSAPDHSWAVVSGLNPDVPQAVAWDDDVVRLADGEPATDDEEVVDNFVNVFFLIKAQHFPT